MIERIVIENFKSFRKAELPLAPLTLLIGANASGKSNAIEAMQLLTWLASGRPLKDLLFAVREQELSLRGGLEDLPGQGAEIMLGCDVEDAPGRSRLSFSVSITLTDEGLQLSRERLVDKDDQTLVFQTDSNDPSRGSRLAFVAEHRMMYRKKALRVMEDLLSILFLDPDPRRMREYSFLQEKSLKRDGSALSSVLRQLTEEEGQKGRILEIIRSFPEQDISDITYIETPRGEVMVQLQETFGGRAVPREAALLSDGTLRVLAVAAALFSVAEGSIVVVEEIDNGVHPGRAEHLLSQIQKVARERNLCVLLTAHNPALLDALPPEAVPDTVACYRDPEQGDSRLVRIEELESYPELVAQGPLGRLMTQGILDRFLKVKELRNRDTKVEQGLAWISEFSRQAKSS